MFLLVGNNPPKAISVVPVESFEACQKMLSQPADKFLDAMLKDGPVGVGMGFACSVIKAPDDPDTEAESGN